jgi:hypothetical protein
MRTQRNFVLRGEKKVEVGGLFWTFKKVVSGSLASKEGIQYPGRIWVGQAAQIVVTIVGILFAVAFILRTGEEIDEERQELGSSYTQTEVQEISNEEWATLTLDDLTVTSMEQTQLDILPERWCVLVICSW